MSRSEPTLLGQCVAEFSLPQFFSFGIGIVALKLAGQVWGCGKLA